MGKMFSGKSRKSHGNQEVPISVLDFLVEYAEKHHVDSSDVETYVFGHLHTPHRRELADFDVLFLSDWSRAEATYAVMDSNSIELKTFKIDETIS